VAKRTATTRTHKRLLTDEERDGWTGFLHAHAAITRVLDDDLRVHHGLAYNSFEVLALLALADGQRLRMAELADQLVFTRSGVTRLIERLERDGYVERCDADDDARGVYAQITDRGFDAFEGAAQTHVALLRELFLSQLEDRELSGLNRLWDRLKSHSCREREQKLRSAAREG
jgi:DNA-binding MarR family transcriptional regulator